jgi:hypothetical protein
MKKLLAKCGLCGAKEDWQRAGRLGKRREKWEDKNRVTYAECDGYKGWVCKACFDTRNKEAKEIEWLRTR